MKYKYTCSHVTPYSLKYGYETPAGKIYIPGTHIEDKITPIKKAPRRRFRSADIPTVGTKEVSSASS